MKLMFNEIGGKVVACNQPSKCHDCVFKETKFCEVIYVGHPLFVPCKYHVFLKSNLDIFNL